MIGTVFGLLFAFGSFEAPLVEQVNKRVEQTIELDGAFAERKNELLPVWETLVREGAYEVVSTDAEARPTFVSLQAIVEHVLATMLDDGVMTLRGVIHTPRPTTPLCTKGEISKELVDPSIAADPDRLFTVQARTSTLREFLKRGGRLSVVYPEGGLERRTEEQQEIYREELANYPMSLIDYPLGCDSIPSELIGATYFFEDGEGNIFAFAIKMAQAKDPRNGGEFGLWFGPVDHPAVRKRLMTVINYFGKVGGPAEFVFAIQER